MAQDANIESIRRVLEELTRREPDKFERAALHAAMFVLANLDPWQHHLGEEIKRMLTDAEIEELRTSPAIREVFEDGEKLGLDQGRKDAIEQMLHALLVHHLRRDLTPEERSTITARAATLDPAHAVEVIRLDPDALHTWLFGPVAE